MDDPEKNTALSEAPWGEGAERVIGSIWFMKVILGPKSGRGLQASSALDEQVSPRLGGLPQRMIDSFSLLMLSLPNHPILFTIWLHSTTLLPRAVQGPRLCSAPSPVPIPFPFLGFP